MSKKKGNKTSKSKKQSNNDVNKISQNTVVQTPEKEVTKEKKIDEEKKDKSQIEEQVNEKAMKKKVKKEENKNQEQVKEKEEKIEDTITILEEKSEQSMVKKEEKEEKETKGLHIYAIIVAVISIVLLIGVMIFSTIFALINRNTGKIVSGVSINGVSVSGLTQDEAKGIINEMYDGKLIKNITLKHGEHEVTFTPEQIEAKFGVEEAVNMAYNIGRSGKILKDNYQIINTKMHNIDITPAFTYNEQSMADFIAGENENLPDKVQQSSYSIDGKKLIITKGKKGYDIKEQELKDLIVNNIIELKPETEPIEMPVSEVQPDKIDLQKIHDEIYKEPKDAYYTQNPFAVYPHENGVDFNITMEEANALLDGEGEEIVIPLKISVPKVTTNQIGQEAFPDLLATYSTTFATSNTNRATNIRLATNKINGTVVMPGKEFSYNAVVGQRTAAAGFKTAGVYVSGRVENGIGGGICQVSSTLYNTALRANLEIIKRSNHMFATGYVPLSTDATVSWGGPEFIFKNSRKYPIKIVAKVNGGTIKVDIFGHKEDVEYEVIIKSETLQTIPMQTEYRTNPSLAPGTTRTVQKGHGGYKSRAYRILKLNGQVVSTQLLSTDTYRQLSTIIEKN